RHYLTGGPDGGRRLGPPADGGRAAASAAGAGGEADADALAGRRRGAGSRGGRDAGPRQRQRGLHLTACPAHRASPAASTYTPAPPATPATVRSRCHAAGSHRPSSQLATIHATSPHATLAPHSRPLAASAAPSSRPSHTPTHRVQTGIGSPPWT